MQGNCPSPIVSVSNIIKAGGALVHLSFCPRYYIPVYLAVLVNVLRIQPTLPSAPCLGQVDHDYAEKVGKVVREAYYYW